MGSFTHAVYGKSTVRTPCAVRRVDCQPWLAMRLDEAVDYTCLWVSSHYTAFSRVCARSHSSTTGEFHVSRHVPAPELWHLCERVSGTVPWMVSVRNRIVWKEPYAKKLLTGNTSYSAASGRCTSTVLGSMEGRGSGTVDHQHTLRRLPHVISLPPSSDLETEEISSYSFGISPSPSSWLQNWGRSHHKTWGYPGARALIEKVDKMLRKDSWRRHRAGGNPSSTCCYSVPMWPFLVQNGDGHVHLGFHKGRCHVCDRSRGCLFLYPPSRIETNPPVCGEREDSPVQSLVLWLFLSTPGFHKSVCSSLEVGSPESYSLSLLSRGLARHHRLSALFTGALLLPTPVWSRPGDRALYLGILMTTSWEKVYPVDSGVTRFSGMTKSI